MQGLHLIADLYDCRCPPELLLERERVAELCRRVCGDAGLSVVAECFHQFGTPEQPAGATGALVLAESHLAVHTWPELGGVTVDLYVCNFSRDNREPARAALDRLLAAFQPARVERQEVIRGGPGGVSHPC